MNVERFIGVCGFAEIVAVTGLIVRIMTFAFTFAHVYMLTSHKLYNVYTI